MFIMNMIIKYNIWHKDSKLHRENRPAIIHTYGSMQWFRTGIFIKSHCK